MRAGSVITMTTLIDRKTAKRNMPKKPKGNSYQIYLRLMGYAKVYLSAFIIATVANVLYSAIDSVFAYLLKPILNKGFVSPDPSFLKLIPVMIIVLFMGRSAMNLIGSYSMGLVARGIVMQFRQQLFKHLMRMPSRFYYKI
jgi:ATP-binding cassette, subfamily B, bacterial MsbA